MENGRPTSQNATHEEILQAMDAALQNGIPPYGDGNIPDWGRESGSIWNRIGDYFRANDMATCSRFLMIIGEAMIRVAGIFLFIVTLACLGISIVKYDFGRPPIYLVVVDAGSSHTAFDLYEWFAARNESGPVISRVATCLADDPDRKGIEQFVDDPISIKGYMSPCLHILTRMITTNYSSDLDDASLFFGATAGMRNLLISNPMATEMIMGTVNGMLKTYGFHDVTAQILEGTKEAKFDWMASNYLSGDFQPGHPMVGTLDMGGSSAEVTLPIGTQTRIPSGKGVAQNVTFGQNFTHLYSHSAQCYGIFESLKRYTALLVYRSYLASNRSLVRHLENPCLPPHIEQTGTSDFFVEFPFEVSDIFDGPCTGDFHDKQFNALIKKLKNTTPSLKFDHLPSNKSTCQDSILDLHIPDRCAKLFNKDVCLNYTRVDTISTDFFAMSSYYSEFFSQIVHDGANTVSYDVAKAEIHKICRTEPPRNQSKTLCFKLNYVMNHLMIGYNGQFTESNFDKIRFQYDIEGTKVSWTMGFASLFADVQGPIVMNRLCTKILWIWVAFAGYAVILAGIGFLIRFHAYKYCMHDGYQELP